MRLLTAHRSKGLEWRLVVVAHVQEGAWPDLRRRDSLLGADRIAPALPDGRHGGLLPPLTRSAMLAEERRLFYVAVTRARSRLVVTAVKSPDDDGDQPSRFLNELGLREDQIRHRVGRPTRPLSLAGLIAELRRTAADPAQPDALREAAARRLRSWPPPRCTASGSRSPQTRRPGGGFGPRRTPRPRCVPRAVRSR